MWVKWPLPLFAFVVQVAFAAIYLFNTCLIISSVWQLADCSHACLIHSHDTPCPLDDGSDANPRRGACIQRLATNMFNFKLDWANRIRGTIWKTPSTGSSRKMELVRKPLLNRQSQFRHSAKGPYHHDDNYSRLLASQAPPPLPFLFCVFYSPPRIGHLADDLVRLNASAVCQELPRLLSNLNCVANSSINDWSQIS